MSKKVQWKGATILSPLPTAMVSVGTMENSNIITIAWTGIINSIPPKTYISVRPERYSYDIIKKSMQFVINMTDHALLEAADFCGFRSGRDIDKFAHFSLTKEKGNVVYCPMIYESPLSLECKVTDIIKFGSHDMFIADIVAVNVRQELIDKNGKLHLDKAELIAFSHGEYFKIGDKAGRFGFSIQKKFIKNKTKATASQEEKAEVKAKPDRKKINSKSQKTFNKPADKTYKKTKAKQGGRKLK